MSFSLDHGRVVMSSEIMHAQSTNIYPLAHMPGTCVLILKVEDLLQFTPTPSSKDIPPHVFYVISHQNVAGRSEGIESNVHIQKHHGSPHLIFSGSLYRPPTAAQGHIHGTHPT